MGEAYFYHLTRAELEPTLTTLVEKSRAAGWHVAVRMHSEALMARLDDILWLRPEEGFLPHGRADQPGAKTQPILLTTEPHQPNGAQCVLSLEGAEIGAEEVTALDRAMILFDGHDPAAVERARAQWRALTGAGCAAKYWSDASGKWEMKAES